MLSSEGVCVLQSRFSELRYKEVINVCSGQRLGYVCDLEIDMCDGRVLSLIVPGEARFGGLLGRSDDYVVPWHCIKRIGDDIILAELPSPEPRARCACRG